MKHWIIAVALIFFGTAARAQTTEQSALQLLADKAKETRPVVRLSPWAGPSYGAYLPVWIFHSKYDQSPDPYKQYFTVGFGGKYDTATKSGNAFGAFEVNLVGLSARAWDWTWANDHVTRSKFPPIWGGFSPDLPISASQAKDWTWKQNGRFQLSIAYPFGGPVP